MVTCWQFPRMNKLRAWFMCSWVTWWASKPDEVLHPCVEKAHAGFKLNLFVSFCLVPLLPQNVLLLEFFGKPIREFQELPYSGRDFCVTQDSPVLCGKRWRPRLAAMRSQPVVRPRLPQPWHLPHILCVPSCWPQRGSCLERAGDTWGDAVEIGFKFNLLIN